MRIYLIGFMGSGKSSLGRRLAKKLAYHFVDLDQEVENQAGISIPDIFLRFGESHFRELEQKALLQSVSHHKAVIATGGGTPCFFDNMKFINEHGVSVYLRMSPASLAYRLEHAQTSRPLVEKHKGDDLLNYIEEKLKEREPWYLQARCIIKGETVKADQIISLVFGH
ncbi:MAG: shikimate kinase [Bacteroides sp.]|jgi:shikimate kinase|nr:shikimate kinase [Bacteroides sp.]